MDGEEAEDFLQKEIVERHNPMQELGGFRKERRAPQCVVPEAGTFNNGEAADEDCSTQYQLVYGGIAAIVSALSAQNVGAKEFAALALVLLTSQGGYEVKSLVAEAGAIPLLLEMMRSSLFTGESAAAALASLVAFHPSNRLAVVRAGGLKTLVSMAKSSYLVSDSIMQARIQAAAAIATLYLSDVLDKNSMSCVALEDVLLGLADLLESQSILEVRAGLGGLQAITSSFNLLRESSWVGEMLPFEMVSALLDTTRSNSQETRQAAIQELVELCSSISSAEGMRKDGVRLLAVLLELPALAEAVTGTFSSLISRGSFIEYFAETHLFSHLMRIVSEGPSLAARTLAMSCIAMLGARQKQLLLLGSHDLTLILNILGSDPEQIHTELDFRTTCLNCYRLEVLKIHASFILLREHAAEVLVYFALSGERQRDQIVAAGGIALLVQLLQECRAPASSNGLYHSSRWLRPYIKLLNPIAPQVIQEFAVMALIVLADKNPNTAERFLRAGGIPVLISLLTTPGAGARFGASWNEMASAALLTMAGHENAKQEMLRCGVVFSLLQVLHGDNKVSYVGVAAMVQLLGIFASYSPEAKSEMTKANMVRCLTEVLIGGGCLAWHDITSNVETSSKHPLELIQEAAASALGSLMLESPENAEATMEAGAIKPLIRLMDIPETTRGLKIELNKMKLGIPSAAAVALRNMVSCFPQCKQEVIAAGGVKKLKGLMQLRHQDGNQGTDNKAELQKLQTLAAHVMTLLKDSGANSCSFDAAQRACVPLYL